jgi:hypothetical protein
VTPSAELELAVAAASPSPTRPKRPTHKKKIAESEPIKTTPAQNEPDKTEPTRAAENIVAFDAKGLNTKRKQQH